MKAISLWEPWASAIRDGLKKIETRSWKTSYRGELAIHATKRVEFGVNDYPVWKCSPGCIICIVELVSCFKMSEDWIASVSPQELKWGDYRAGRWAWMLDQPRPMCPPLPIRGKQGLWNVMLFTQTPRSKVSANVE